MIILIISEYCKLVQKKSITLDWLVGEGDPLEIVQEIEILTIRTSDKYAIQNPLCRMRCTKFSGILRFQTDHLISARRPDLMIDKKKRESAK